MSSPAETPAPTRRGLITGGLVVGTLLTLSPIFGVIGTVVGMMTSFEALGANGAAGDTEALSRGIGQSLVATATGLILFLPGVVILTLSIIHHRRAKKAAAARSAPPSG